MGEESGLSYCPCMIRVKRADSINKPQIIGIYIHPGEKF
jgi:hypothetical protein